MTTPDPGWYDDPQDPNVLRYWDGQDWTPHRQRKTTSPPTRQSATTPPPNQPPTPPSLPPPTPSGPTPQDQLQLHLEKGRRFWSSMPGQQKIMVAIAASAVVVIAIMVPVFAFGHKAAQSGRAGPTGGSQYYQWGYESATSGAARRSYIDLSCTGFYGCSDPGPDAIKQACGGGWVEDENVPADMKVADPDSGTYRANKDEYVRGCGDAFRDHPPSPTVTTRTRH